MIAELDIGIGTEEVVVVETLADRKAVKLDVVLLFGDEIAFFSLKDVHGFGGDEKVVQTVGEVVLLATL